MRRAVGILGGALLLLLAGCGALGLDRELPSSPTPTPPPEVSGPATPPSPRPTATPRATSAPRTPTPTPTPTPAPPQGPLVPGSLTLVPALGARTFDRPVELVPYPDGTFLIADQSGVVMRLAADGRELGTFVDQQPQTLRAGNEEGLLSVALDPEFASNRYVYLYASRGGPRRTMLARYTVAPNNTIDPGSELVILEVAQPFPNHKGGAIRFGADGLLYLGFGDGGSGGDPGDRAQNLQELLGKIVRLDVRGATEERPYEAAGDAGLTARGARPEIWAYGFRNPWRMAFDEAGTTLYVGDVGQDRFEEVGVAVPGGNHGWPILEGVTCFRPASNCPRAGLVLPLATYPLRTEGNCSVTAGPVLDGSLLYADFCSGTIWAVPVEGGEPVRVLDTSLRIASFTRDGGGNIYVVAHGAAISRVVRVR